MKRIRNTFKSWDDYKSFYTNEQRDSAIRMGYIDPKKPHYVSRYNWALDRLKDFGAKTVLDIGSGMGDFPIFISQHGISVDAIEPQRSDYSYFMEQLTLADYLPPIKRSEQTQPIHTYNEFFEDHQPTRHYDAITAFEVIEHIYDLTPFLNKVKSLLKKGGEFLFSTPTAEGRFGESWDNPLHLWVATEESLADTFKGWEIVELVILPEDLDTFVGRVKKKGTYTAPINPGAKSSPPRYYTPFVVEQLGYALEELISSTRPG